MPQTIIELPRDVLLCIAAALPPEALRALSACCWATQRLVSSPHVTAAWVLARVNPGLALGAPTSPPQPPLSASSNAVATTDTTAASGGACMRGHATREHAELSWALHALPCSYAVARMLAAKFQPAVWAALPPPAAALLSQWVALWAVQQAEQRHSCLAGHRELQPDQCDCPTHGQQGRAVEQEDGDAEHNGALHHGLCQSWAQLHSRQRLGTNEQPINTAAEPAGACTWALDWALGPPCAATESTQVWAAAYGRAFHECRRAALLCAAAQGQAWAVRRLLQLLLLPTDCAPTAHAPQPCAVQQCSQATAPALDAVQLTSPAAALAGAVQPSRPAAPLLPRIPSTPLLLCRSTDSPADAPTDLSTDLPPLTSLSAPGSPAFPHTSPPLSPPSPHLPHLDAAAAAAAAAAASVLRSVEGQPAAFASTSVTSHVTLASCYAPLEVSTLDRAPHFLGLAGVNPPPTGGSTERLLLEALQQALSHGQDAVVPLLLDGLGARRGPVARGTTAGATATAAGATPGPSGSVGNGSTDGPGCSSAHTIAVLQTPEGHEQQQHQQQRTRHPQHLQQSQQSQQSRLAAHAELLLACAVRGGSRDAMALLLHPPPRGSGLDVQAGSNRALRSAAVRGDAAMASAGGGRRGVKGHGGGGRREAE